jgi:hypothetical protein
LKTTQVCFIPITGWIFQMILIAYSHSSSSNAFPMRSVYSACFFSTLSGAHSPQQLQPAQYSTTNTVTSAPPQVPQPRPIKLRAVEVGILFRRLLHCVLFLSPFFCMSLHVCFIVHCRHSPSIPSFSLIHSYFLQ